MCDKCSSELCEKPNIFVFVNENASWSLTFGSSNIVTLFEKIIPLCSQGIINIQIDAKISAETQPSGGFGIYNQYILYVDNEQVDQAGYAADGNLNIDYAPELASTSLQWAGYSSEKKSITIKLTAQLFPSPYNDGDSGISNINNSSGNYQGAKNAVLRVITS